MAGLRTIFKPTPDQIKDCLCSLYKHVIEEYGNSIEELSKQLTDNINENTELPPIIGLLSSFSWLKAPAGIFNAIRKLRELKNRSDQARKLGGLIAKTNLDERHGEQALAEAVLEIFTAFELPFINALLNDKGELQDGAIKLTAQTLVKIIIDYNTTKGINEIKTADIINAIKEYEVHDNCLEKGFNAVKKITLPVSSGAKKLQLKHIKSGGTIDDTESISVDPRKLLSKAGIVDPDDIRITGLVKGIRVLELFKPKGRVIKSNTYKYYYRLPFTEEDLDLEKMTPLENCPYDEYKHYLWNQIKSNKSDLVKMMLEKLPSDWEDATKDLKELKEELSSINTKLDNISIEKKGETSKMVQQIHILESNLMENTTYTRTQEATQGEGTQAIIDRNNTTIGSTFVTTQK